MVTSKTNLNNFLKELPSIDSLLRTATAEEVRPLVGDEHCTALARLVIDELRREILSNTWPITPAEPANGKQARQTLLAEAEHRLRIRNHKESQRGLTQVVNATGVILHTNLGRASLSEAARQAVCDAAGYCNLEYDLVEGNRGRRGARAEDLLAEITGAEAALLANNCASAALLALTVLASEGQTIVSRGELVEIGGDFRVPDVMAQSGTKMIEVGTTNRTRLSDYRAALSDRTRLIMRVHPSNYRIVGFTRRPSLAELVALSHESGLKIYEDAGSGALVDLAPFGIEGEPVISSLISAGVDVVSFSGDKLLGGPQIGCLVGRRETIDRMRKHPLYRALRSDKLRIAALEATLSAYARRTWSEELPTLRAIKLTASEIESRASNLIDRLRPKMKSSLSLSVFEGRSASGGGSAPTSELPTFLISVHHDRLTANEIEATLRQIRPPVISRIVEDQVVLDLRTVTEDEEACIERALLSLPN